MIQALLHHKSHIGLIEDEKTSMIIGTLLHLPTTLMLKIISDALTNECSALRNKTEEHLQKVPEFWPHWFTKTNRVEPDVFMRFESFDLIIEAKRNDDKTSQESSQLNRELNAYEYVYGKDKQVYLIALGGNVDDIKSVEERRDKILTCSWNNLLSSIESSIERKKIESSIERKKGEIQKYDEIYRILSDCRDAFALFGHVTGWLYELCDLEYKQINKKSIENIKLWKV